MNLGEWKEPILGAIACVGFLGFAVVFILASAKRFSRFERAWAAYARSRGYELSRHTGTGFLILSIGVPPRIRGTFEGTPFEIGLVNWEARKWNHTYVSADIAAPPDAPRGAEVVEDAMTPDVRSAWHALKARRPRAILRVWPTDPRREPGRTAARVMANWSVIDADAETLDAAIALVTRLAKEPPARLGAGYRPPLYLRV